MIEKLVWVAFIAALAGIFWVSGDGLYRYPCMDPAQWSSNPECKPPICSATRTCPSDLTGGAINVTQ
jgi:hypothetical protein